MSTNIYADPEKKSHWDVRVPAITEAPFHRLAAARSQQNIDLETLARRLGTTVERIQREEQSAGNAPLSVLHRWANALGVPVAELLVERDPRYLTGDLGRDRADRLLDAAQEILAESRCRATRQLTALFIEQLAKIVPELQPGHSRGGPRRSRQPRPLRKLPTKLFSWPAMRRKWDVGVEHANCQTRMTAATLH